MSDTAVATGENTTKQFYLRKAKGKDKTVTIPKTDIDAVLFDMDGVASFLESRNIKLPRDDKSDKLGLDTVCSIGNLKDQIFSEQLKEHHAQAYETTVVLIQLLKRAGIKVAVITVSENGSAVLKAANLQNIFDTKVDGLDANALHCSFIYSQAKN